MGLIPDDIEKHYLLGGESQRLLSAWGELEKVRTQAILAKFLPPPPAVLLDIGGAAGAYAFPLASRGYQVHLIDPVELHLMQARSFASESGIALASIIQGDARRSNFPADSADAILLLGPLYHLVERSDRLQALREARRTLKRGGILFAAGISRFASLIDGLSRGFFQDAAFRKIVEADLNSGLHRNPTDRAEYFTTAYFHRPEELAGEISEAGFRDVRTLAVEGPAWCAAQFREVWSDAGEQQRLLESLALIESEPSLLGASAHILAVASRST